MTGARSGAVLLALAYAGFVSIGLPDGLLGVATPSMRATFELGPDAIGALLLSYAAGYLAASFASGAIVSRLGIGTVLAWSCFATGASLLGYATAPSWAVLVAWAIVTGLGAGTVDAGLNTFAATRHGVRTLNWLHACYGVGAASGPVLMGALLEAGRAWQLGYVVVGVSQLALAGAFGLTRRRWSSTGGHDAGGTRGVPLGATLRRADVWLGVVTFTAYTGVEAAAGVWAYSYFTEARGVTPALAAVCASAFYGSFTAGRFLLGAIAERFPLTAFLRTCSLAIVAGAALLWLAPDAVALAGLVLIGVGCAPIFPSLMAATPARVGAEHAANAIGFQVCGATLGLSGLPALVGVLAARSGLSVLGPVLFAASIVLALLGEALWRRGAGPAAVPDDRVGCATEPSD